MNRFIMVALFFLPVIIHAQDLQLTHNGKTKTIKAGTFIEVALPGKQLCETCPFYTVAGQLLSYANNKMHLKIKTSTEPIIDNKVHIGSQTNNYTSGDGAPVMEITKDNILSVTKRGKNKVREQTTGEVIGITLMMLGLGHLAASPVVEITEGNDSGLLLALGAGEFLAGLVLSLSSDEKTYITHPDHPESPEKEKIWKLN